MSTSKFSDCRKYTFIPTTSYFVGNEEIRRLPKTGSGIFGSSMKSADQGISIPDCVSQSYLFCSRICFAPPTVAVAGNREWQ
ncbi:hypothetical protein HPDFL43_00021560 [Hoeflea phototrophica DFL-43]|uniref:Uncharacterized protein n=1 Tax=Hoeflea phototrophica (strain DSM 17068 / NCIMB 14078 / DFL-43) TaxID=411684 RepID=A0A094Z2C9_HOEPD|nr:hypothetical protein HPDFL43_00021560 [Hoeflea phototrophica DFL-43]